MTRNASGFTLLEILAASLAAAMILLAIYGIFQRTVKTRDNGVARIREARQRERVANSIRNDLSNAFVSSGTLANTMEGGTQNQKSRFPGYLRFTTTTARNKAGDAYGDVQQIEYYITDAIVSGSGASAVAASDSAPDGSETGMLVRAVTRDLLSSNQSAPAVEEVLLPRVQTLEVTFYDGQDWQESWQLTGTDTTLPQAIRLRIRQAAASTQLSTPMPLEILVPITAEAMGSTASTPAATPTPTATPTASPSASATASATGTTSAK